MTSQSRRRLWGPGPVVAGLGTAALSVAGSSPSNYATIHPMVVGFLTSVGVGVVDLSLFPLVVLGVVDLSLVPLVVLGAVNLSLVPLVVLGAVAVAVVMSIVFLISGENVYDQIGQGGMTRDREAPPEEAFAPTSAAAATATGAGAGSATLSSSAARAEQEREVRQMLGARSARMVARGETALDLDAEVAKLLSPAEAAGGAEAAGANATGAGTAGTGTAGTAGMTSAASAGAAGAEGGAGGTPGSPGSAHDAELEAEVRELVVAKNERRARRGLEPLDVAAEVQRTLAELSP